MGSSDSMIQKYQETIEALQQEIEAADPPRNIAKAM